MRINLSVEGVRQGSVLTEASDKSHPIMQLEGLSLYTTLVERSNNFYEAAHNEREEGHSSQHNHYHTELLVLRNWVKVTVTDCRKSSNGEVATSNKLVIERDLLSLIVFIR
jgi:hypothetical protein